MNIYINCVVYMLHHGGDVRLAGWIFSSAEALAAYGFARAPEAEDFKRRRDFRIYT